jgi:hydroxypyruvate isomerase
MPFEDMCREAARKGAAGFDGVPPEQWPLLKKYGLISAMALGGGMTIETGIIQKQTHNELAKSLGDFIDTCAVNGCPSAVIVGGQRNRMSYAQGADNAVAFFKSGQEPR